jgi:hypothetical protein
MAGMVSALTEFSSKTTFFAAFLIVGLIEVVYMSRKGLWSEYGFDINSHKSMKLILLSPLMVIAMIPIFAGIDNGLNLLDIIYIIVYMLIVAFVEEVLYRGIILSNLKTKSVKFGIIGSAVMFGLSHLITASSGKALLDVLFLIIMALTVGIILGLIIIYTGNIYICIAYHFINNVCVSISRSYGIADKAISYAVLLLLIIYAFVLYSKLKNDEQSDLNIIE